MVVIRLSRGGAKKRAFYHIVATDKRNARDAGTHLEQLGFFNPVANGQEERLRINRERVDYWLKQGAKPSERVQKLLEDSAA